MHPFELTTARLVLNQPNADDVEDIARYCTDPLFEQFMVTPWPYERQHAEWFVEQAVPTGWADGTEWNWAIRARADSPLMGVIGVRHASGMIGYWLGSPYRGTGLMSEATRAVIDAIFERSELERLHWECRHGNVASLRTAQKVGFRYAGVADGTILARDGNPVSSWVAILDKHDSREPKAGWPSH